MTAAGRSGVGESARGEQAGGQAAAEGGRQARGQACAEGGRQAGGGVGAERGRQFGGRVGAEGGRRAGGQSSPEAVGQTGVPVGAAERGAWAALAAAWAVASETGAPLASSLRELAGALRDDAQLRREVRAALAGPRASAKLVTTLPLVAVVFGMLLGFDTAGVLLGNPLGWACLAVGSALLWLGARWNRALAGRAAPPNASPGLELDLLAIAMSSGASVDGAIAVTRRAIATHLPGAQSDGRDIAATVRLATRAGAPVADLLRAEAFRQRRTARADGAVRAAALSVRLMIPLGVCILPAFVLLGVAPLMISVITGTLGGAR
jgi:tight adherence protein B